MPSSGDVPNPGIEPRAPALQADSLPSEPPGKTNFTSLDNIYQFDLLLQFLLELMLEYISSNTFKPIVWAEMVTGLENHDLNTDKK